MNKKQLTLTFLAATTVVTLTACSGFNSVMSKKTETVEWYRVYDVKTNAKVGTITEALKSGLSRNTTPTTNRNIPRTRELPDEPGRFIIGEPFEGTRVGMLMSGAGQARMKVVQCKDALWTAHGDRSVSGSNKATVDVCVYPYKKGYHIDVVGTMTKVSGGLMEISRQLAYAAVGTPEEWLEKSMQDPIRALYEKTGASIEVIEAYPEIQGTPWIDDTKASSVGIKEVQ